MDDNFNSAPTMKSPSLIAIVGLTLAFSASAAESEAPMTASDLASRLRALQENSVSFIRLRMEIKGATNETLQLQIKERRTTNSSEVVYQVLYPKERKGESVLLQKVGNSRATVAVFLPPDALRPIDDLKEPLLGSDLSYEDVVENFFAWEHQAIVGNEMVDTVNCQILESKPGSGEVSIYGSVKSWIDVRRLVPLRVEKYAKSGGLLRRIDTTRVVADAGHYIPADLTVTGARSNSLTLLDGSRIEHKVIYTDRDFTTEGLKQLTAPRRSDEYENRMRTPR